MAEGTQSARARLEWYLRRLQVMRPAEIIHRGQEAAKRAAYRRRAPRVHLVPRDVATAEVLRPSLLKLSTVPDAIAHWEAAAQQFRDGSVTLLGRTWSLVPAPNWRLDPETGREWPSDYAFDIDYRQGAASLGEAKYVWELNRLLYLLPVAAHAERTGDAALCESLKAQIDDWIRENPVFQGVAWASGIEVALRLIAMIGVDELVQQVRADAAFAERVHASVLTHVDWLARFPSRHSSANNHRVAELGGLLVAAAKYRSVSQRIDVARLVAEFDEVGSAQFHPDGVGAEQSPTYAAFSLEWLAVTAAAMGEAGWVLPTGLSATMRRAAHGIDVITDINGHVVRYGDDDEGRVLTSAVPTERFFAGVDALLPRDLAADSAEGDPGDETRLHVFPDGGYSVARTNDFGSEMLWVIDHGPLGFGEIAAHGHADTLSVWLHVDGMPVFVDAGTYLYHSGGSWREYMRATHAHNTVVLGGLSSSVTAGAFNWRHNRRATGSLLATRPAPDWVVDAEHDGYSESLGVIHHRVVRRLGEGRFRITDTAVGSSPVSARWSLLLAPDLDADPIANGWQVHRGDVDVLQVTTTSDFKRTELRGSTEPLAGWHSARFGSVEPATQLILEGELGAGSPLEVDVTLSGRG